MAKKQSTQPTNTFFYPPIVAVLGHVDHGKTTLLDAIRKSNIAQKEHGGITQKIGASTIEVMHEGQKRRVTFIDTPGHEAFSKMRGRGTQAADIGLLIVSAADGVMPQTRESIQLLKDQQVPFIVVLTKIDLPEKNIEKVKQQIIRENVLLEGYGGDVPFIEVSARTGNNVKELLDLILLVFDLRSHAVEQKGSPVFKAIVIESRIDQKVGPRATLVVKQGSVAVRDEIIADTIEGRIRAFINDKGESLKEISIGDAVEVLGFTQAPKVGSVVYKKNELSQVQNENKEQTTFMQKQAGQISEALPEGTLSLILVTDTEGSLEAIVQSLPKGIHIIAKKTGDVSEADILHAKSTGAIILTFNIKIKNDVAQFALLEKILLKNYTIIYELLQEIYDVMEGKRLALVEQIFGTARILASFPYESTTVLGISILDGRIAKGDKIRIMRNDTEVGESNIVSLRQGKNSISKIEKGQEAGILISPFLDFQIGDVIISHS